MKALSDTGLPTAAKPLAATHATGLLHDAAPAIDRALVDELLGRMRAVTWGSRGHVAHLFETPQPHRHVERESVRVIAGKGFAGDHPEKSFYKRKLVPGREVSAVAIETLHVLGVDPVVVGDNLITEGIELGALEEGDLMEIGDVVLERSWQPHNPCTTFRNRTSPEAFAVVSRNRYRGAVFVVRTGGEIRRGDEIIVARRQSADRLRAFS